MIAKTKQAGQVKVGERISTNNGMREVLRIETQPSGVVLVVQCPATLLGESNIRCLLTTPVRFLPAELPN